jgi:GTPase SAR1 family protein
MSKGYVKKIFPGAITSKGFFSYYDNMIIQDCRHIFVIKGGPGVGKSTFMKKIAEKMFEKGYCIEYHCCSSDNNSIDGIVIPEEGIAFLDGTAPHVVDPKNPGAVDEIINLGEYWNEELIANSKQDIIKTNYKIGRYFQAAYFALSEAKNALDEWKFYVHEYQNWTYINQLMLKVEKEILKVIPKGIGKDRHLFAWAHTPQGKTQFIDTLLYGINKLYTLSGQPGCGKSTFLNRIAERAIILGQDVEYYHNTLDPSQLDLIIMPGIQTAMVITSEPYTYEPKFDGKIIALDFDYSLDKSELKKIESDVNDCRQRVNQHIERALKNSLRAKQTHDLLESFYIPAMDFAGIEKERLNILQRIFNMVEKEKIIAVSTPTPENIDKC